jgi:signal transduction histidine kinase
VSRVVDWALAAADARPWLASLMLPADHTELATRLRGVGASMGRATGERPRLSLWAWLSDAILALVLAMTTSLEAWRDRSSALGGKVVPSFPMPDVRAVPPQPVGPPEPVGPGSGGHEVVLGLAYWQLAIVVALAALALLVRRRVPLTAFCSVVIATLVFRSYASPGAERAYGLLVVSCVITGYSASRHSPYRTGARAAVATALLLAALVTFQGFPRLGLYAALLVLTAVAFAANAIHTSRLRVLAVEADQAEATRLAVDEERARIARELHDVVTHNVSVMVVQAGAARKVLDVSPEAARAALLAVESGGRAAMAELRHVMGLLTMTGDGPDPAATADLAPQPGLEQLETLVARLRETGVPATLTVDGPLVALPTGVDLTAYRVVQEALTNTVKHAAGASVTITVGYRDDALRIQVTDTGGTPTTAAAAGSGRGLIGLRERLAVYGGTLHAGAHPTGGYRVHATIPLGPVSPLEAP